LPSYLLYAQHAVVGFFLVLIRDPPSVVSTRRRNTFFFFSPDEVDRRIREKKAKAKARRGFYDQATPTFVGEAGGETAVDVGKGTRRAFLAFSLLCPLSVSCSFLSLPLSIVSQ
jgi:hypothetical protein